MSTGDVVVWSVGTLPAAFAYQMGARRYVVYLLAGLVPHALVFGWRLTPWGMREERHEQRSLNDMGPKARIVPWKQKVAATTLLIVGGLIGVFAIMALIGGFAVSDVRAVAIGVVCGCVTFAMVAKGLKMG